MFEALEWRPSGYDESARGRAAGYLESVLRAVNASWPYLARRDGRDHVLGMCRDAGRCHLPPHLQYAIRNMIALSCMADSTSEFATCRFPGHDVVVPPSMGMPLVQSAWFWSPEHVQAQRRTLAVFRGSIHAGTIRKAVVDRLSNDSDFIVGGWVPDAQYEHELLNSVYVICPAQFVAWNPRVFQGMARGAIPVVVADGLELPFEFALGSSASVVHVPTRLVNRIPEILRGIPAHEVERRQRRVAQIWRSFFWDGEAAELVLSELAARARQLLSSQAEATVNYLGPHGHEHFMWPASIPRIHPSGIICD